MKVEVKTLNEMTAIEWCKLAEERVKVFVVEQECPYQEIDKQDYKAHHLMLFDDRGELVGYTRIMDKDNQHSTFGRVLILKNYRKHGYGQRLVRATIDEAKKLFPQKKIQIQAQAYLQKFYTSFGFKPISDVYLEDNIPHLDMVLD
ncbi:GNAT family N-acetyltransferase [Limosilactobacillus walteri]|uniref:GNAT family N-acetyltransferase n=1 Tax=Limosilactobacillus walteri TaxID=2268022 RepID=A0ABR8P6G7_9LACO|nr:GNAT family N-acetyltransferase [Limosilactobacillus walteri]MBD5806294.1 GNAT family N-acetyltransferase [Limosilactobacillus walteri]